MSVAGFSPFVVDAANVMPGPKRFPSAGLLGVLDRNEAVGEQGYSRASSGAA